MGKETKHLQHFFKAFTWSLQGLGSAMRNELAFRQEIVLLAILFPTGLYLGRTASEKALLTGVLFLVPIVELVNSSIEATLDRVSEEHHPLTGRAKDMGSAAVFMAIVNVLAVWGILLFDMFAG